jgi:hypothetical protein
MNIKTSLCRWDTRNPDSVPLSHRDSDDPKEPPSGCACDACFYGKHAMADELLSAYEMLAECALSYLHKKDGLITHSFDSMDESLCNYLSRRGILKLVSRGLYRLSESNATVHRPAPAGPVQHLVGCEPQNREKP